MNKEDNYFFHDSSYIDENVEIGEGTWIGSNVTITSIDPPSGSSTTSSSPKSVVYSFKSDSIDSIMSSPRPTFSIVKAHSRESSSIST